MRYKVAKKEGEMKKTMVKTVPVLVAVLLLLAPGMMMRAADNPVQEYVDPI
jgi:hypothetical protein